MSERWNGHERRSAPPISKETGIALGVVAILLSAAVTGTATYYGLRGSIAEVRAEQQQLRAEMTNVRLADLGRRIDAAWSVEDHRRWIQLARVQPLLSALPTVDDLLYQPQARGPWLPPRSPNRDLAAQADDRPLLPDDGPR